MDLYLVHLNFSDTTLFSLRWVGDYAWEATFFWVFFGHIGFFFIDKRHIRNLWVLGRRLLHMWGNFKFFYFILYFFLFIYLCIFVYFLRDSTCILLGSLANLFVLVIELLVLIYILNYYKVSLTIVDLIATVSLISYQRILAIMYLKTGLTTDLKLIFKYSPFDYKTYLFTFCFYLERFFLVMLDPSFILDESDSYSILIKTYFLIKEYTLLFFSKRLLSLSEVLEEFFTEFFDLIYKQSYTEEKLKEKTVYFHQIKPSQKDLNLVDNVFPNNKSHRHFLRDFMNFLFFSVFYVTFTFICEVFLIWKLFFVNGLHFYIITSINFPLFTWVLRVDNLSFIFLFLLALLTPICVILHFWKEFKTLLYYTQYVSCARSLSDNLFYLFMLYSLVLILCLLFLTNDLFIFYLMFELSMIPLLFIILHYGSRKNKIKATKYYFFYTLFGSFFFLIALYLLWSNYGTTDYLILKKVLYVEQDSILLKLIWINLFIPFAIKIPIVPFHSWLPEAHVEAPTEGSVLLAGVLLKVGAYGMIRFLIDLLPHISLYFSPVVLLLSSISIVYNSFVIFRQVDLKKIIAYFSIIHMNMALLGLFTFTSYGIVGSIFIFFIHGLVSSGLFIFVGFLYQRFHTRNYLCYSGLVTIMPVFACMSFLFFLANFAFPGTGSFIGELLVLLAIFQKNSFIGVITLISVFSSAVFSLIIFTKMFFGIFRFSIYYNIYNFYLFFYEYFILFYLLFFIFFFGLFPNLLLDLFIF